MARFGDDLHTGRVRPVIDSVFPMTEMEAAHERMREDHFGKIACGWIKKIAFVPLPERRLAR